MHPVPHAGVYEAGVLDLSRSRQILFAAAAISRNETVTAGRAAIEAAELPTAAAAGRAELGERRYTQQKNED
jgi:hypothetical protein